MNQGWRKFREGQSRDDEVCAKDAPYPKNSMDGTFWEGEIASKMGLLVVDDERDIVDSLREAFCSQFQIFHSTSAPEALDLFKTHNPPIVLSDQRMPEMMGLDLLRQIKEIEPATIRILITGYSDINVVVRAINEGLVWKYITKPWDHAKLRDIVIQGAREYAKMHKAYMPLFRTVGGW